MNLSRMERSEKSTSRRGSLLLSGSASVSRRSAWIRFGLVAILLFPFCSKAQMDEHLIGYLGLHFPAGFKLVTFPLLRADSTVSNVFSTAPDRTEIYRYTGRRFETESTTNLNGAWSDPNFHFSLGEAYVVRSFEAWDDSYVGEIPQGKMKGLLPQGLSFRGPTVPQGGLLSQVLQFPAVEGTIVSNIDMVTGQPVLVASYTGTGWDPAEPVLYVTDGMIVETPKRLVWSREFYVNGGPAPSANSCFANQPQGIAAQLGSQVTLGASIIAGITSTYQWQFNGVDIAGATNQTLVLDSLQREQAGDYWVRINCSGLEFSDIATVKAIDSEAGLQIVRNASGYNSISATFPQNWTPILEISNDLSSWQSVTNAFANGATYNDYAGVPFSRRYYRLRLR